MSGGRAVEAILVDWRAAERMLVEAPKEHWLAILARIDELQDEYQRAMADRESEAEEPRQVGYAEMS